MSGILIISNIFAALNYIMNAGLCSDLPNGHVKY